MPKKSSAPDESSSLAVSENIEARILNLRGQKVMLDNDLAALYGVSTKALNQAVKRNLARFPADFMFRLTREETDELNRSQFVTGSQKHRDPRFSPYAFTEHGVVMLATILNSPIAIEASIQVVRAFVRLRSILAEHQELARRLEALEKDTKTNFKAVFDLIEKYLKAAPKERRQMGFLAEKK
jgi:hypothetical protein